MEFSPPVPEKKFFEGFLPYMDMAAILSCDPDAANKLDLKTFLQNLFKINTVVSEKIRFEFLYMYVQDLGPRSRNDPDLQYSHTIIYSIKCLLLLISRSLATRVSEKSTVFTFSYSKAYVTTFDLAVK